MAKYTVLLLYPDTANDSGQETYLAHVEADNAALAICQAQLDAAFENSPADDPFRYDQADFFPLFACAGHQDDLRQ